MLALCTAASPRAVHAGAWTQPHGRLYARLSANRYFADQDYGTSGRTTPFSAHGEFTDLNVAQYIEYGVTNRITAVASLAYKSLRDRNGDGVSKAWGIGDIDLALRGKIAEGRAGVVAVQFLAKVPKAYDADAILPLGNGQYDYEARLLYGRSLWQLFPGYCNFEIAHRWRDRAPSDEIRYLAEVGSDFGRGFYGRSKLDGIRSRNNGLGLDTSGNPTARNNYDLTKLDLVVGRKLGARWSVEAGFAPSVYGRTTAAGSTISAAVSYVNR
jgi:protein XagA